MRWYNVFQDGADFYGSPEPKAEAMPIVTYRGMVRNDSDMRGAMRARRHFIMDMAMQDDEIRWEQYVM